MIFGQLKNLKNSYIFTQCLKPTARLVSDNFIREWWFYHILWFILKLVYINLVLTSALLIPGQNTSVQSFQSINYI